LQKKILYKNYNIKTGPRNPENDEIYLFSPELELRLLLVLMHKLLQDYIMATDAQFSSCIATNASAKRRNSETENDPEAPRLNAKKRSANCPPVRSLARSLVLQRKSKSHRFL
jgi:hypothetical protein